MDIKFVIAQCLGAVALILVCCAYFMRSRKSFLLLNILANFLYACAFLTQNLLVAGIDTIISVCRTAGLYIFVKNDIKPKPEYFFLNLAAYFINTSLFFQTPLDLLVLSTSIVFTIAYFSNNLRVTRALVILPNMVLTFYNIYFGLYTNAILSAVETCIAISAVIKFKIERKKAVN